MAVAGPGPGPPQLATRRTVEGAPWFVLEAWGVRAVVPVGGAEGAGPASAGGRSCWGFSDQVVKRLCDGCSSLVLVLGRFGRLMFGLPSPSQLCRVSFRCCVGYGRRAGFRAHAYRYRGGSPRVSYVAPCVFIGSWVVRQSRERFLGVMVMFGVFV